MGVGIGYLPTPPAPREQANSCEKITFPQLRWQAVNIQCKRNHSSMMRTDCSLPYVASHQMSATVGSLSELSWTGIQSWPPDVTSKGDQGPVRRAGMTCTEGDRGPVQ